EPDLNDKRNKIISLTEKGAEYNQITSQISKELIETFYKDFTDSEKEKLWAFLCRIEKNFSDF
ncbi:MAG: transcriptional regulator, partial [Treponema sp.]|nr:transcriptional regulator [Treponema sp.]